MRPGNLSAEIPKYFEGSFRPGSAAGQPWGRYWTTGRNVRILTVRVQAARLLQPVHDDEYIPQAAGAPFEWSTWGGEDIAFQRGAGTMGNLMSRVYFSRKEETGASFGDMTPSFRFALPMQPFTVREKIPRTIPRSRNVLPCPPE